MRIDKFIWAVRLYKTRSLSAKECASDKVKLNDEFCKASKPVKIGDEVSVKVNPVWKTFKVKDLPKSRISASLVSDYIVETTNEESLQELKHFQQIQKQMRQQGFRGRPTKRDRRKLDDFGY